MQISSEKGVIFGCFPYLDFFIANVELESGKRLQPYYDKADRPLVDNFKKVINHEYGLTNPDDPLKAQSLKQGYETPKTVREYKEQINEFIENAVISGQIKSQDDIKSILEKSGFEVTRTTQKSISIKNPDGGRNLRLDGDIYGKEFYEKTGTIEQFRENFGGRARGDESPQTADISRVYEQLERGVEGRKERNKTLYSRAERLVDTDNGYINDLSRDMDFYSSKRISETERHQEPEKRDSELGTDEAVFTVIRTIYEPKANRGSTRRKGSVIHSNDRRNSQNIHDRTRTQSPLSTQKIKEFRDELSRRIK